MSSVRWTTLYCLGSSEETGYKVSICPRVKWLNMRIYVLTDHNLAQRVCLGLWNYYFIPESTLYAVILYLVFTVLQCLDVYFTDWLTFVGTSDLVKSLGEGPRVQEEEDRRGDGDQRDQLAQPEIRKEERWGEWGSLTLVRERIGRSLFFLASNVKVRLSFFRPHCCRRGHRFNFGYQSKFQQNMLVSCLDYQKMQKLK